MSDSHHLHVTDDPFFQSPVRRRVRPASPYDVDDGLESLFSFPPPTKKPTLRDIDIRNGTLRSPSPPRDAFISTPSSNMDFEARIQALTELAEKQQEQMNRQQEQMNKATEFANSTAAQLQESQRQLQESQQTVNRLSDAFQALSTRPQQAAASAPSAPPKKKPELPPFDSKNVLVWIRRIESAYIRVGCVEPRDKFAWMESIFQVKLDPQIDAYLYGGNTAQDWDDFISYLKLRFGPTVRQKAQKMMSEVPRHDLTPSQFLLQLEEDTKDVTADQIRREHLLKTIPSRIREIMGKQVETMTAKEVATLADTFFDRQGRPLEKTAAPVNQVAAASQLPSTTSSTPPTSSTTFTAAYSDEEDTDINFVRGRNNGGQNRGRSRGRFGRSNSRPPFNSFSNSSSTGSSQNQSSSSHSKGTCRWHRQFGEKSLKCVTDCPKYKSFVASQKQGNGQGGRRQ